MVSSPSPIMAVVQSLIPTALVGLIAAALRTKMHSVWAVLLGYVCTWLFCIHSDQFGMVWGTGLGAALLLAGFLVADHRKNSVRAARHGGAPSGSGQIESDRDLRQRLEAAQSRIAELEGQRTAGLGVVGEQPTPHANSGVGSFSPSTEDALAQSKSLLEQAIASKEHAERALRWEREDNAQEKGRLLRRLRAVDERAAAEHEITQSQLVVLGSRLQERGWRLVSLRDGNDFVELLGPPVTLGSFDLRIGSAKDSHIVLPSEEARPVHAVLRTQGASVSLEDFGGTLANCEQLSGSSKSLKSRDFISIGTWFGVITDETDQFRVASRFGLVDPLTELATRPVLGHYRILAAGMLGVAGSQVVTFAAAIRSAVPMADHRQRVLLGRLLSGPFATKSGSSLGVVRAAVLGGVVPMASADDVVGLLRDVVPEVERVLDGGAVCVALTQGDTSWDELADRASRLAAESTAQGLACSVVEDVATTDKK